MVVKASTDTSGWALATVGNWSTWRRRHRRRGVACAQLHRALLRRQDYVGNRQLLDRGRCAPSGGPSRRRQLGDVTAAFCQRGMRAAAASGRRWRQLLDHALHDTEAEDRSAAMYQGRLGRHQCRG